MKISTKPYFILFILLFSCQEDEIYSSSNPNIDSQIVSNKDSKQIYPFRFLNQMFLSNRSPNIQNFEVYSDLMSNTHPFFYNWNPNNKLLYIGNSPFECKTSGLSGVYYGLDSSSILKLENLPLLTLSDSLIKTILIDARSNPSSMGLISKSLNSNTCNIFEN